MRDEQVVIFKLGEEHYAVGMSTVREIIVPPKIRSVPNAKEYVQGIINLRGKVIPILSLAKLLKLESVPSLPELQRQIVVLENEETLLGIEVDGVNEVLNIAQYELEPTPKVIGQETFIDGILNLGEGLIMMRNAPALFAT
ncbi:chemotaxis protein CheW [Desulfitobacterium sp.]|uniref:chemotaxis protein CheW n=1 Tax=Desulfitobacterium sp. TaxID=49981 RepID=UPI002CB231C4|nr:chemotaxis protein CheW [Desulfitobacterium sp.]HVJ50056.1 chemotaxis protein CheW [Desulfitobacterium sp.]